MGIEPADRHGRGAALCLTHLPLADGAARLARQGQPTRLAAVRAPAAPFRSAGVLQQVEVTRHTIRTPAPRGVPQIEVTFDIDANGIVNVSAKDLGTGKEQQITITSSSGLDEKEIDNMVKDAETHAEEDKKKRELVDSKNQLENLIYATEKNLNENKEKIPMVQVQSIEEAIEQANKVKDSENVDEIKVAIDKLTQASHKLAEEMYKKAQEEQAQAAAQQAQQDAPPPPEEGAAAGEKSEGSDDDNVVDAEYEDVK